MNTLTVAKFGGSSLATASGILNCVTLAQKNNNQLVVVSANGKVTQTLHDFWWYFCQGDESKAEALYERMQRYYMQILCDLPLPDQYKEGFYPILDDLFDALNTKTPEEAFNSQVRDHILSFGEKLSVTLFSIMAQGLYHYIPAQDFFITDSAYGEARPFEKQIQKKVKTKLQPLIQEEKFIVTEGFVGQDPMGNPTTIGFEGSDYSAALLANMLEAKSLTIWTDVAGIYSADPRLVFAPKPIPEMSYDYAAQVSLYGAKILHPRTLSPLKSKNIPLMVKSSFRPRAQGTLIAETVTQSEPILTYYEGKALIHNASEHQLKALKEKYNVFSFSEAIFYPIHAIIVDEKRSLESFMEEVFKTFSLK
jgi:aspartate kinase